MLSVSLHNDARVMADDVTSAARADRERDRRRDPSALAWSLVIGAMWDVGFGLPALLAPAWLSRLVGIEAPAPVLRISGVLLLMVAGVYLVAARDPDANPGIVAIAIAGRGLGALVLAQGFYAYRSDIYALAAGADLGFGALHAWLWSRRR